MASRERQGKAKAGSGPPLGVEGQLEESPEICMKEGEAAEGGPNPKQRGSQRALTAGDELLGEPYV